MTLDGFAPATRAWFGSAFAAPTPAQELAWDAIRRGDHTLVIAPTGSGKTLAAFLWSLDRLTSAPMMSAEHAGCRVVYVSPLKALAVDVERNLTAPLTGIRQAAARLGQPAARVSIAVRSGDTPAAERRGFARAPADILITTPESLFLLLTSAARESLRTVDTVIVDEVHAVAATKRGAHLALSLERLDALLPRPAQRIGLSATVRPVEEVAAFLGGGRPVSVVAPASSKTLEVSVSVPVEDMTAFGRDAGQESDAAAGPEERTSIWPAVESRIVELIRAHRSTIVFANSRRVAERLCARINDLAAQADPDGVPGELARAHHGSVSREQRKQIEEDLKSGRLPAVVATSSLELGIDMGAVDLVVQVESPPSVASGLQRLGRAGHQVGAVSRGVMLPKHRGDLVASAVVAERMTAGAIEALSYPRNPLDVLAQQVIAMVAMEDWDVDELAVVVRRAANFAGLSPAVFEAVLDMLAGLYPSDDFAELRPRLVWDRHAGRLTSRPGAQRLAVTSGGTIPDRGLFGVFLVGENTSRVGELDEEMVYESRVGEVFALGSTSWRIEDITHDRVLVSPAPGQPGKLPFWHGDTLGRPLELGRAVGAFLRELTRLGPEAGVARARDAGLDESAARNLVAYVEEQRVATGHVPDDRTLVVERFRDELGDWRLCVHSPFGAAVNAPWALAVAARLRERQGMDVGAMHSDDGIVVRFPDGEDPPSAADILFDPEEVAELVQAEVAGSALFASRFRECAARALLLPRRDPRRRTPLWQQRQRASQLLSVAARFETFPIVLETLRECLQDVFDVAGLVEVMGDVRSRSMRVVDIETTQASPFARSLLFGYVAAFMYEGDAPLAERRAQALSLDPGLLAELLGQAELRELLDPQALAEVEAELAGLDPNRRARHAEDVADLLRRLGDLSTAEALARGATPAWLAELEGQRRVLRVRIAGEERWISVEDAGRVLDALGVPLPVGVPEVFVEPVADPLGDLLSRYGRTHGPFTEREAAGRFGLGVAVVAGGLARLAATGRLVHGEFRPGGTDREWCDAEVLRRLRRRSLARLRHEVEPVPRAALARFLPAWHGVGGGRGAGGVPAAAAAVDTLAGAVVPASTLESLVLPLRIPSYTPALLDELCSTGEVLWAGAGSLPGNDGWITLCPAELAPLLLAAPDPAAVSSPLHEAVLGALTGGRAPFFRDLADQVANLDDRALLTAIWDLVWGGWVTNDTLLPLRAHVTGRPAARRGGPVTASGGLPRRRLASRSLPRGRPAMPSRSGPPAAAGRWSLLPERDTDPTRRAHALAEALLERHGVLTRGAVAAERVPGGFAAVYPVLRALEESGRIRRGYFVDGLGAAQFAVPGAVDRLRATSDAPSRGSDPPGWAAPGPDTGPVRPPVRTAAPGALLLSATDPANPYGAALPWPDRQGGSGGVRAAGTQTAGTQTAETRTAETRPSAGHRPGRKAGALVVLVEGELTVYVERGGATLLSWTEDPERLTAAVDALALAVRDGLLGRLTVERADGSAVAGSVLGQILERAGFNPTPRGLRLRA